MNSGKYAFSAPAALIRASISATHALPDGVPDRSDDHRARAPGRCRPARALAMTSWYQRGKSSARGVSTRAMSRHPSQPRRTPVPVTRPAVAHRSARHERLITAVDVMIGGHSIAANVHDRADLGGLRRDRFTIGGAAAQDDAPRVEQGAQVLPGVAVVDDQVGQAALDQAGEAEPLPGAPGAGRAARPRWTCRPARAAAASPAAASPCSIAAAGVGADVDRHAGLVRAGAPPPGSRSRSAQHVLGVPGELRLAPARRCRRTSRY